MATPKVTIPRSAVWEKFRWITDYVPCFGISGNNVHVITEPMTFYETFKVRKDIHLLEFIVATVK